MGRAEAEGRSRRHSCAAGPRNPDPDGDRRPFLGGGQAEWQEGQVSGRKRRDQYVRTGNGIIRVSSGRAAELKVGGIVRHDIGLQVADNDNLNVLGMNFLSSLNRWGVEGRWLVLVP